MSQDNTGKNQSLQTRILPSNAKSKQREKMPIEKRAKQFVPFSALSGLDEILRQKEWEVEMRQKLKDKVWRIED